jgi:hypothetical protein
MACISLFGFYFYQNSEHHQLSPVDGNNCCVLDHTAVPYPEKMLAEHS